MSVLSVKEREVVAVGAAVGAGCRPCTQYHVRAGLKAGLTEEDIRLAVEEAEVLRIHAATSIADFARGLLGADEERAAPLCGPQERQQALALLGAAGGGNAGHLLTWLLPQARGLGFENDALKEALDLATMVKKMAGEFFAKDAERALGGANVTWPAADGSCVSAPAHVAGVADAREPAATTPTSCC